MSLAAGGIVCSNYDQSEIFERALQVPVQVVASSCCCNNYWDIVSLGIGK